LTIPFRGIQCFVSLSIWLLRDVQAEYSFFARAGRSFDGVLEEIPHAVEQLVGPVVVSPGGYANPHNCYNCY
jgi:hypothetical protein